MRHKTGQQREYTPAEGDDAQPTARTQPIAKQTTGYLKDRVGKIETAQDPADILFGKMKFPLNALDRHRHVIAQQIIDEAQGKYQRQNAHPYRNSGNQRFHRATAQLVI